MPGYNIRVLLDWIIEIYSWLLIARIIFPLLRLGRNTHTLLLQLRRGVYALTEPVLAPIRQVIVPIQLGAGAYLDLSPLIAMLLLRFLRSILWRVFF